MNANLQISNWPLVQMVVAALEARGIEGVLVGGAVRDGLLGRPVHDWDFVVEREAIPLARQVANRLGATYYTLDAERETGRVVVRQTDGSRVFLDFALRRGNDWVADLTARDFTVNAMAFVLSPPRGLLDPLNGQADLAARRVRAAGEAAFRDDPVRILRCVRVAAMLGFGIEAQTAEWARQAAPWLWRVSAERMRDELAHLLAMDGLADNLRQLDALEALTRVLPEMAPLKTTHQSLPHHWNVFEHTLILVEMLDQILDLLRPDRSCRPVRSLPPAHVWGELERALGPFAGDLRKHLAATLSDERTVLESLKLAALLHDCGKPATLHVDEGGRTRFFNHDQVGAEMAAARARALRFANVEVERIRIIVANHMRPQQLADSGLTARGMYRYFRDMGKAGVDIVLLALADHLATHGPDLDARRWDRRLNAASELIGSYLERLQRQIKSPPLVNGKELMRTLGLSTGPRIGELLEAIREAQAVGEIHTKQEALELARRRVESGK